MADSRTRVRRYFQMAARVFSEISAHKAGVSLTEPMMKPLRSAKSASVFRANKIGKFLAQLAKY